MSNLNTRFCIHQVVGDGSPLDPTLEAQTKVRRGLLIAIADVAADENGVLFSEVSQVCGALSKDNKKWRPIYVRQETAPPGVIMEKSEKQADISAEAITLYLAHLGLWDHEPWRKAMLVYTGSKLNTGASGAYVMKRGGAVNYEAGIENLRAGVMCIPENS